MLISKEKSLLFIHIQKTGGSSIRRMLKRCVPDAKDWMGTHDHASWAKNTLGSEYELYYKFAFVRNPWDRLVSWYMMIKRRAEITPRNRMNLICNYVLDNSSTFDGFIINCTDTIDDINGRKSFLYNQYDYISDENGELIVDYVGRYENYESDLKRLVKGFGSFDIKIPHLNKTEHMHYSAYYSQRTKDIIAERYERDIKAFGYLFEEP